MVALLTALPTRKRLALLLAAAGLLFAGGVGVWWFRPSPPPPDDPLAVYSSPFQNTRPEVKYVGDAACANCHVTHADSYRHHPMGRSLTAVAHSPPLERYDAAAHPQFEQLGFRFTAERTADNMVHKAQRLDADGRVRAESVIDAAYAIGSGTRGRSYLFGRDGYLFQSPVSWYSEKGRWDLSPGFEALYPPDRPIEGACLFCHANLVDPVANTRNRYREPVFRGETIGCERCHGPGELHVASRTQGGAPVRPFDDTIVNPKHLEPALRDAVCQQCHLQGVKRVVRQGHETFDYRPGLPLHAFYSIFVRKAEFQDNRTAVGQVEQMQQSHCFQASAGKLGCVSCHDPHAVPAADKRVSFFRDRCLNCHRDDTGGEPAAAATVSAPACSLPPAARRQQEKEDSCIACHMPRAPSSNIAHTAITDHRVRRQPAPARPPRPLQPGELPIANFFADRLPADDAGADRDLGIALVYLAPNEPRLREVLVPLGYPYLERATQWAPADVDAWEAKGWALAVLGHRKEALQALEQALRVAPDREVALSLAAQVAERLGRTDDEVRYLQRAVAVNPWIWDYQDRLAAALARLHDWPAARPAAEAALRLNPGSPRTRKVLITCYLGGGDEARARRELETLVALYPKDAEELRRWFADQAR